MTSESRTSLVQAVYERLRATLGVRQAIRETARQTGVPYTEVRRLLGFDWLLPEGDAR